MGKAHGRHHQRTGRRTWPLLLALAAAAGLLVLITHAVSQPQTVTHTVTRTVQHTVTRTVPGPVRVVTRQAPKQPPAHYTVRPGDTLWDIAAAHYVAGIEKANAAMLTRQHGVIYAGDVLLLPAQAP